MTAPTCPAAVKVLDDHYGVLTDYCRLPAGHAGDHRSPRRASRSHTSAGPTTKGGTVASDESGAQEYAATWWELAAVYSAGVLVGAAVATTVGWLVLCVLAAVVMFYVGLERRK